MPVATGFFLVREQEMLDAIPTDRTVVHTLTATKNGERAAAAWAIIQRVGYEGYVESTRHVLNLVDVVVDGIRGIDGLKLLVEPFTTVVNFTSDGPDLGKVHDGLQARGWGHTYGEINGAERIRLSIHPHRDLEHTHGFLNALEESVIAARRSG
jgi:glutamate/tyrosine decarboxylase-like PLP-dependent enzyme